MENNASSEQQGIIDNIVLGNNVCSISVAGSGKSTTILLLANKLKEQKILHMTYNSSLRKEFREKVEESNITNIDVHTFHSFAVRYFVSNAFTDGGIRDILLKKIQPIKEIPCYNIIVIDECQDLTPLYYRFIIYFLSLLKNKIQMIVLGDPLQSLYEFKGSDHRFLTFASKLWSNQPFLQTPVFQHCCLKTSYRLTDQMSEFINTVLYNEKFIDTCRSGSPISYIRNNNYCIEKYIITIVKDIINNGELPNDIFILAASVSGINSQIKKLENLLTENGIPCYIPYSDIEKVDERVISGKLVFSTFHTVKGRQRKYVFVIGFDNSYFEFYAKTLSKEKCPNTLYVACTRSTDHLFLIENNNRNIDRPLDFLQLGHHAMKEKSFITFKGNPQSIFYEQKPMNQINIPIYYVTISKLVKFIPESDLDIISPILQKIFINVSNTNRIHFDETEIPNVIQLIDGSFEDVSDINNIVIPCIFYDIICNNTIGESNLYKLISNDMMKLKQNEHLYLKQLFTQLNSQCNNVSDYLFLSNFYIALKEKLYFKLKHIRKEDCTWLTKNTIEKCNLFLQQCILNYQSDDPFTIMHETTIIENEDYKHTQIDDILKKHFNECIFRFTARIDFITDDAIWEIRCSSHLTIEHFLHIVIYAWLWQCIYPEKKRKFNISNIKSGEIFELNASMDELTTILIILLKNAYKKEDIIISDDDFLKQFCFVHPSFNL